MKNKTILNNCKHEFCKECIQQWSNSTNVCPLCKEEFQKLIYYDTNNKLKEQKVRKRKFKYEEEEEKWLENCQDNCMVCDDSSNEHLLLVCDQCNYYVCHTYCAELDLIPSDEWICYECKGEEYKQNNNNIRK